ncbi:polyamine ABC transporter substrate-binding protein [Spirilliplanes yamanashiensis]|uniref:ABC transporter substrate-binding protein n=1 Tax=Spirilliplanes yamanashiensis TaxID=42233 RepID=A0A8J3YD27_9ACTN|nr:spermidine/putrescine ABC transporter substrate-binding protein [Spirilliplanes yamanashiensis]MDP9816110.1 spermidine/putrescine transport system substrate-binding protein [Spirilliplanes yamanashiensis]GIJ05632.1 ABC transporter substrate-binding protein [Spirilliplanes yamanashiensis]
MRRSTLPLTRRTLLRGTAAASLATALAACGTKGAKQTEASCVSEDVSGAEKTLQFSNWTQYIDVDGDARPTLAAFQQQTGITVTYTEDINDNNQFFGKIQQQLSACQPTGRDVIVLTDWLVGRLVQLGWVQKLDLAKMPNVQANLLPSLKGRSVDPQNDHAVPWQGGLAAIAYNAGATKEVRTIDELLTRADLKGRVTLLAEMRDTMGLIMQSNGHDPSNFTAAQFDDALAKLKRAVDAGQIRKFTGNEYTTDLERGDIAACLAWSGDVLQLSAENDRIRFVAPDSGAILFSDDALVPNRAGHKANAEQLLNYYYQPEVAAKVAAEVNYICPVVGAQEAMTKIDPELAENPLIFPTPELLGNAKDFMVLDEAASREYERKFQTVIGA